MKHILIAASTAIFVISVSVPVLSHTMLPNTKVVSTVVLPPSAASASTAEQRGGMNAVVNAYKLWQAGSKPNVCFWAGTDPRVRKFFVEAEREWERYANLHWDFGAAPSYRTCGESPSHIRIAFDHVGHWSTVGTDAISKDIYPHPSLNIDVSAFGTWELVDKSQVRGVILHEVGHAFGLEHEHQSPADPCISSIRWNTVYTEMAKPPNQWKSEKVDINLKALVNVDRLRVTDYDRHSIMHYTFPASWFDDPTCAVTQSVELSDTDKQEIALAYPQNRNEQQAFVNNVNTRASAIVETMQLNKEQQNRLAKDIKTIPQRLDTRLAPGTAIQINDNSTNNGVIHNGQITVGDVNVTGNRTNGCGSGIIGLNLGNATSNCPR